MDTNIKVAKLMKQYESEKKEQEQNLIKEQGKIQEERSRVLRERQSRFSSLNPEELRSHQKSIENHHSANRERIKTEIEERKKQEAEYIAHFDQKLRSKTYSNTLSYDINQKEQNLTKQELIKELKINQNQYAEKIRTQIKQNTVDEAEKMLFPKIKESIKIDDENKEILRSMIQHSNDQSMQTIGYNNQTPQTLQIPKKNSRYFSYSENNQSQSPSSMKTRIMGIENLKYMKKLPKRRQQVAQSLDYEHKINYLDEIRGKFKCRSPKSPQDMMLKARQLELKSQHAYPRSRVKGDKYLLLSIQTKLDILQM